MKTVSIELAQRLIDFAPTEETRRMGFAESQLEGTVAAYNMLAHNRIAYLADEVGMGKTYVALGVMGLLRYLNPGARILVLTPRENIQLKWIKEFTNFVHLNWKLRDNRVKGVNKEPVHSAVACSRFDELGHLIQVNDNRDLYLRNSMFSVSVRDSEARKRCRKRIREFVPWIPSQFLDARMNELDFRDSYGRVLNALMPSIELLVVDEAHNFKHGFGRGVSNRNRIVGLALGHPDGTTPECEWYRHRIKRVLMLSATPFEYDYADLHRQLDVFGFGNVEIADPLGGDRIPVRRLLGDDEAEMRALVKRFLIRRVAYLNIAGKRHSKNQYRREWRYGGYQVHDQPMSLDDPRQRLVVGLIQKKVTEVLGDDRFNNSFQIGMLSSFESFMESLTRSQRLQLRRASTEEDENEEMIRVFDGDQTDDHSERLGMDSHSLRAVVQSYERQFNSTLPHPKLDATADFLKDCFDIGVKSLVFVRRVATTGELKRKLDAHYDAWIYNRMRTGLPAELRPQLENIFDLYKQEQAQGRTPSWQHRDASNGTPALLYDEDDDAGDTDSFFAWYFRGEGPANILSGAAFHKNRLRSFSSVYATLFEDDRVAWLLDYPSDPLSTLAETLGQSVPELSRLLREDAWQHFRMRSKQKEGYPRLFVFESYQIAALRRLASLPNELGHRATIVLDERYENVGLERSIPPEGFPDAQDSIGVATFFTSLSQRPRLRERLWPEENTDEPRESFRRREQRRELISAQSRLGHAYIDLYMIAIGMLQSFDLRSEGAVNNPAQLLVERFLDLLDAQMEGQGFGAFHELASTAEAFDMLVAVNFPEVRSAKLGELATIYGRTLQHQMPIGRMHGGVNKRMVRQFRMPGYPFVLITTDVLQEGEDLHTFCKQVIHYGISWTPSAMEQRTGRVDRIGSLVQRQLDGREADPLPGELIQVFYPHLEDTVERFQVRRVLERLNKFVRMVHEPFPSILDWESRIDVTKEVLRRNELPPPVAGMLESAYPVAAASLDGELGVDSITHASIKPLEALFGELCRHVVAKLQAKRLLADNARFEAEVAICDGRIIPNLDELPAEARSQQFSLALRSRAAGDEMVIRCASPIGLANLNDRAMLDDFYDWQRVLMTARLCARLGDHHLSIMSIEMDRLFHLEATQPEEIEELVTSVVMQADRMKCEILAS